MRCSKWDTSVRLESGSKKQGEGRSLPSLRCDRLRTDIVHSSGHSRIVTISLYFYTFQLNRAAHILGNCFWPQSEFTVHLTGISEGSLNKISWCNLAVSTPSLQYLCHQHWTTNVFTIYQKELWLLLKKRGGRFTLYQAQFKHFSSFFIFELQGLVYIVFWCAALGYSTVFSTLKSTLNVFCAFTNISKYNFPA